MTNEEALVKVKGYLTDYFSITDYNEVEEIMTALEQKVGKWELIPYQTMQYGYRCNLCHFKVVDKQNYCPNCGADMREREEEE